jgi:hypothetical protein
MPSTWVARRAGTAAKFALACLILAALGAASTAGAVTSTTRPSTSSTRAPTTVPAPATPKLYYTTNHPPALKVADYSVSGDVLQIGTIRTVATLPGADGVGLAPDGDVIVGGGGTGNVFKINPKTGAVLTAPAFPGSSAAFHVTTSRDGSNAWTAGLPGQLAMVPLKPFGPGTAVSLKGDDPGVTTVAFTPAGTFYTSSNSLGSGQFGTLDLATHTTKRILTNVRGAHGISYDSFTKDVFLFGSYSIVQIDPLAISQPGPDHSQVEVSQRVIGNTAFDQGIADGSGHVLVASNTGQVWFIDYSATGLIGAAKGVVASHTFLDTNLDDILTVSPPSVAGAALQAKPASSKKKLIPIVGGAVVVVGLLAFFVVRGRRGGSNSGGKNAAVF